MKTKSQLYILSGLFAAGLALPIAALADTPQNAEPPQHDLTVAQPQGDPKQAPIDQRGSLATDQSDRNAASAVSAEQIASKMHLVNQKEIDMGKIALSRAQNQGVKSFGRRLMDDHAKADKQLQETAKKAGITLAAPEMPAKDRQMKSELESLSGNEFDKKFLIHMRDGHHEVAAELKDAQAKLPDGDLKKLIKKQLPTIESHEKTAIQLLKITKNG